jgi:hypothetical protein
MHQELIQQTHEIEGSLDYHVFGGSNNHAAPSEGRVVHIHHDMIWLNEAQFKAMKYVAQHYFIHPRPGHPLVSNEPVLVETGPTEEELINFLVQPTFEKAIPEHYSMVHDSSCICEICRPVESMSSAAVEESVEEVEAEVIVVDDSHVEVVEVEMPTKKGKKRHLVDDN